MVWHDAHQVVMRCRSCALKIVGDACIIWHKNVLVCCGVMV
ncbi:hypothetical protein EPHNCH_1418 [Anaplasma phagocytophilum str. NCH-1]|uniref:Uncharacterized protein n=1 Tax=Anaplasma phagocytophilum str. NCH-1 TaxID=1359161 RepID=A0A0F3N5C6_ANAPH|nr:hypothetical protein EPHNCH_1418 [Anaplasma phagocytophilum str. NCH-1]